MDQPTRGSRAALALAASVLAALAIYGIWTLQSRPSSNGHGELRPITIAQFGDFFLYAPLYVAVDGGFFQKEGLQVTIVSTGGDDKTWAAVLSGSADFGVADPTFVAISAARGQGGVVVASVVNGAPFWGITFRNLPPITDARALKPYSVATFASPSTAYTLQRKMFTDAGLPPNIRESAFGAIVPMAQHGDVDIGLELEPNVSQAVSDGAKIVYSLAERYGDFAITGVTTTNATLKSDPALVRKVRTALQGALDLLHADPSRALALLARRFPGVPPAVARAALERVLRDKVIPISTLISEDAWNKAIQVRIAVGDLKEPAPYSRFVAPGEETTK